MNLQIIGKFRDEISKKLEGTLKKAKSGLSGLGSAIRSSATSFAKWAAAAVGAAVAAGAAIFKSQAASIDALAKTSDKLGIAVEDLQALRFAAEQTGVSANVLDTALQRMTRRVAEAAQGSGAAANALKELGLDAKALKNQTPDEAFASVAEAMEGVASQGDRVRLAMQIFDTEGVALVNTMQGGAAAINAFKKEAEELGLTLSRVDAAKVEQTNDAFNRINKILTGSLQQATAKIAPIITALADAFTEAIKNAGGLGPVLDKVFNFGVKVVGTFANGIRGIQIIVETLKLGFFGFATAINTVFLKVSQTIDSLINGAINSINVLINGINKIPGVEVSPIGQFVSGGTKMFAENTEYWAEMMGESVNKIRDLALKELPSTAIERFVDTSIKKATDAAEAFADAADERAKLARAEAELQAQRAADAERDASIKKQLAAIQKGLRTELEVLDEKYEQERAVVQAAIDNRLGDETELRRQLLLLEENYQSDKAKIMDKANADERKRLEKEAAIQDQLIRDRAKEMQKQIDSVQGVFKSLFGDLINDSNNAFKNLLGNFKKLVDDMITEALAANVMKALFGDIAIGTDSSGRSVGASAQGGWLSSLFNGIFGREMGGPVQANMPYIVGEKRPEIFVPRQDGTILPNLAMAGSGSMQVNINAIDSKGVAEFIEQNKFAMTKAVQSTAQRYNVR